MLMFSVFFCFRDLCVIKTNKKVESRVFLMMKEEVEEKKKTKLRESVELFLRLIFSSKTIKKRIRNCARFSGEIFFYFQL